MNQFLEHAIFYGSLTLCTAIIAVALHGFRKTTDSLWKCTFAIALCSTLLLGLTLTQEYLTNQEQYYQCIKKAPPNKGQRSTYSIIVSSDAHLFPSTHFTAMQHGKEFL
jgi:hypothetical protein